MSTSVSGRRVVQPAVHPFGKDRLCLVQIARHAGVLRAAAGEQERHIRPIQRGCACARGGRCPVPAGAPPRRGFRRRSPGAFQRRGGPFAASRPHRPAAVRDARADAPPAGRHCRPAPSWTAPDSVRIWNGQSLSLGRGHAPAPPAAPHGHWCRRRPANSPRRGADARRAASRVSRSLTRKRRGLEINGRVRRLDSPDDGGICRLCSASDALISDATPAAVSRWPMLVLTDPMRQWPVRHRWSPQRPASAPPPRSGRPDRCPVPWHST